MDKEEIRANLKNLKQSPHGYSKERQLEIVYWYCKYPKRSRPDSELEETHRIYIAKHLVVSETNLWSEFANIERVLKIGDVRDLPEEVCEVLNEYLTSLPERSYEITERNSDHVVEVDTGPDFRQLVWPPEETERAQSPGMTAAFFGPTQQNETPAVSGQSQGSGSEGPGNNWLRQAVEDIQPRRRTVLSTLGLIAVLLILLGGWITRTPGWLFDRDEPETAEEIPQEDEVIAQEDIEPTPNLQETVDAGVFLTMEALPSPTIPPSTTPLPTPDEDATVQAGVDAGVATSLAQTPDPTNTPIPTNTPRPTRTPFPTAAPTLEPLVEANFNNGNEIDEDPRWNTTGDNYSVSGGELNVLGKLNAVYHVEDWADFVIEYEITNMPNSARYSSGGGFFIVMRKQPDGNEMHFSMGSVNGCHTEWAEILGGEGEVIAGSNKDIEACTGNFKIVVEGNRYTLYRNGEYQHDVVNDSFTSGGIAFGSDSRRDNSSFAIDSFAVRPIPPSGDS